jgi:hypothetical protein
LFTGDTLQSFGGPRQEHDENKKSESGKSNNIVIVLSSLNTIRLICECIKSFFSSNI